MAHLLAAEAADVVFEGDRYGHGSVAVDVSCHITDLASAETIRDDLGDAIATSGFDARPPWIGPPLTDAERLARATYRRWSNGMVAAFNDLEIRDLAEQIAASSNADDRAAAMAAFQRKIQERGMANVEGELDPETMASWPTPPSAPTPTRTTPGRGRSASAWAGSRSTRRSTGTSPSADDDARMPYFGAVRVNGDRLEIAQFSAGRFGAGFPYLAGYLADHGCDDLRARVFDITP